MEEVRPRITSLRTSTADLPIAAAYRDVYRSIAEEDVRRSIQDSDVLRARALSDFANIRKTCPSFSGISVLEIGPGLGFLAQILVSKGAVVSLLDLAEPYLERLADDVNGYLMIGDITDPDLELPAVFDLIVVTDVLEHLLRPADALANIKRALKPAGKVYVRVPANESLHAYAAFVGCPHEIVHLRTYSKAILRRELRSVGFSILKGPRVAQGEPRLRRAFLQRSERYWLESHQALKAAYSGKVTPRITGFQRLKAALVTGAKPKNPSSVEMIVFPVTRLLSLALGSPSSLWLVATTSKR